jgi:hypothetical protein
MDDKMMAQLRIGKNMEGSGRGLIEAISRYLSGKTEDIHENLQSG